MASTAIDDHEMMKERYDSQEELLSKVDRLAELVRSSRNFVAFTGAGISTSAGIPDFRGPKGKWTRESKGLKPLKGVSVVDAYPTVTHMSFLELYNRGVLKYVISQNCDGLHRRSGLPASAISELHGNCWVEICEDCGQQYFRDFKCTRFQREGGAKMPTDHFTGRFCACGGRLLNSTIDFGQSLPQKPLDLALRHSSKADLHMACGSSLRVNPACGMPKTTKKAGGKLVIVNLQKTPLTDMADMQIYAPTDTVMTLLMERLGFAIPQFRLLRRIVVGKCHGEWQVYAKGVDVYDPNVEIGHIRSVDWSGQGPMENKAEFDGIVEHQWSCKVGSLNLIALTFHFIGHYHEPPLCLSIDLSRASAADVSLSFDPYEGVWSVLEQVNIEDGKLQSPLNALEARIPDYGKTHMEYCVAMVVQHKGCSQKDAEAIIQGRFDTGRREACRVRATPISGAAPKAYARRQASSMSVMAGRALVNAPPSTPAKDAAQPPRSRSVAVQRSPPADAAHRPSNEHRDRSIIQGVRAR